MYVNEMKHIGTHASRLNRRPVSEPTLSAMANGSSTQVGSAVHVPGNQIKLALREDLLLDLYRQWTLYDSLQRTESTACHFRVWTARGQARLREFLADCGFVIYILKVIILFYLLYIEFLPLKVLNVLLLPQAIYD